MKTTLKIYLNGEINPKAAALEIQSMLRNRNTRCDCPLCKAIKTAVVVPSIVPSDLPESPTAKE